MRSIYEQLKTENYEVQWGGEASGGERDFKIASNIPSAKFPERWINCIYVPHSVSEFFPGGPTYTWPCKFKGVFTVGLATDEKVRGHPLCDPHDVRMVGWPKGDILFSPRKKEIAEQLRESLDFPYEKTVLFTCAPVGHLRWEMSILNEIIPYAKGRFNIIIKERAINYPNLFSDKKHIWYVELTEDVTPYYLVTDLLLSVHPASSTVTEICQVNKPSISIDFLGEEWPRKYRFMYLGEPDVLCRLRELNSNITRLLKDSEQYDDKRREKLEHFIHKPNGHATERAVHEIKEWIKNETDDS